MYKLAYTCKNETEYKVVLTLSGRIMPHCIAMDKSHYIRVWLKTVRKTYNVTSNFLQFGW
jgi:hypothetical protein